MACDFYRSNPNQSRRALEVIKISVAVAETALIYKAWLNSDEAQGDVYWQYENDDDTDQLVLKIGFSHPPTAFAFKMKFV